MPSELDASADGERHARAMQCYEFVTRHGESPRRHLGPHRAASEREAVALSGEALQHFSWGFVGKVTRPASGRGRDGSEHRTMSGPQGSVLGKNRCLCASSCSAKSVLRGVCVGKLQKQAASPKPASLVEAQPCGPAFQAPPLDLRCFLGSRLGRST